MDRIFKKEINLRTSDFDCYCHLTPSAILDLFQEVAGHHAETLGLGFDALNEKNLLWVIVKVKFEVFSHPLMHSTVTLKTWPLPPTRIGFQREYLIEDADGNTLIKGTSDWVVIDSVERKFVPSGNIYPEGFDFCTDRCFDEKTSKIKDFDAQSEGTTIMPQFSDLDMNGHVNNIRYANFVLNTINPDKNEIIKTFQTDYIHEVLSDVPLIIYYNRDGNEVISKGINSDGEHMFRTKITFE